jgi:hypothetical protein
MKVFYNTKAVLILEAHWEFALYSIIEATLLIRYRNGKNVAVFATGTGVGKFASFSGTK